MTCSVRAPLNYFPLVVSMEKVVFTDDSWQIRTVKIRFLRLVKFNTRCFSMFFSLYPVVLSWILIWLFPLIFLCISVSHWILTKLTILIWWVLRGHRNDIVERILLLANLFHVFVQVCVGTTVGESRSFSVLLILFADVLLMNEPKGGGQTRQASWRIVHFSCLPLTAGDLKHDMHSTRWVASVKC